MVGPVLRAACLGARPSAAAFGPAGGARRGLRAGRCPPAVASTTIGLGDAEVERAYQAAIRGHEGEWKGDWRTIGSTRGTGREMDPVARRTTIVGRPDELQLSIRVEEGGAEGEGALSSTEVAFDSSLAVGFAGPMFAQWGVMGGAGSVALELGIRHGEHRVRFVVVYDAGDDLEGARGLSKVTVVRESLASASEGSGERALREGVGFDEWLGGWAGSTHTWDERGGRERPVKWWVDGAESKGGFSAPLNAWTPCTLSTGEVAMQSIRLQGGMVAAFPEALAPGGEVAHKVVVNWLPSKDHMYRGQAYFVPPPPGSPPGTLPIEFAIDELQRTASRS